MTNTRPNYKSLKRFFEEFFCIKNLNVDITEKFALISLICYLTQQLKRKQPDVTYYQVVYKLAENSGLPEEFINGIAILCDSFGDGSKEFPTFDLKGKQIPLKIKDILNAYMPF